ncbi:hypothetical protein E3N88_04066 [Mikania micrantha]|uniref:Uncharacterized protein n=1 Tax=Mikania micrantha TaxID=192012 RepID=A0A5N6PVI9_9ASTR|nr:hypothetical protein E3N88_04066 [Mikania micrantha]
MAENPFRRMAHEYEPFGRMSRENEWSMSRENEWSMSRENEWSMSRENEWSMSRENESFGCPRAFEQSTHPSWHPNDSAAGRGVTDWYQSLGYRELGY